MKARAMWKGVVRLGRARIGVRLYAAAEDSGVHFRLLHEADRAPVRQALVDPATGEEVKRDRVQKGYAIDPETFVVFGKEELDSLEPEDSRDIEPVRFVPRGSIAPSWYDRPYWLGPDAGASADFAALVAALDEEERDAVVRWVMRDRARVGVLRSDGRNLALLTLRHADEVLPAKEIEVPAPAAVSAKEMKLAEQLVEALDDRFEPLPRGDDYAARVKKLVAAKARGRKPPRHAAPRRAAAPRSLTGALAASLRAAERTRKRKAAHG